MARVMIGIGWGDVDPTFPEPDGGSGEPGGGDPGEQIEALFFSDWRTQSGNTTTALSDGGKWDTLSSGAEQNASIIEAPVGFSTHKVLRILTNGHRDGWTEPRVTTLGVLGIGSSRNFRWEIAFHEPALSDAGQHPIQDGGAVSVSNWYLGTTNGGSNLQAGQWGIDFVFGGNSVWNDSKWTLGSQEGQYTPLTKGTVYRMEVQLHRLDTSTFRFKVWIHDSSGNLLYDHTNFRNRVGTSGLGSYAHTFQNVGNTAVFLCGLNGIANQAAPVGWPIHSSDQAAFAVVDGLEEGEQIGPYGRVDGEIPRS